QQPEHGRHDGYGRCRAPRNRSRRAGDAAEHRSRDLDRVRHGHRHLGGAHDHPLQDLLRARERPLERPARALHLEHAHGAVGAGGGLARRSLRVAHAPGAPEGMSPAAGARERLFRIGEVAELTGTTPRTIRYYEEIGLVPEAEDRVSGKRRLYTRADVDRLAELIRLRDLLGLSLDDLKRLVEAETARAGLRERWNHTEDPTERR